MAIIGHFWTVGLKSVAWGLDGAVNDNTAKGRGLGLGFFAPNKSLADSKLLRDRDGLIFSLSPQLFFAYSRLLTP